MSEAATTTSIVSLAIDGMSSRACVTRLERALSDVPAVLAVNVRLESQSAKVELSDMQTEAAAIAAVEALLAASATLGFEAHLRGYEGPPVSNSVGNTVDDAADNEAGAGTTPAAQADQTDQADRANSSAPVPPLAPEARAAREGERPPRRFREAGSARASRIEPEFGPDLPKDLSSPTEPELHGWAAPTADADNPATATEARTAPQAAPQSAAAAAAAAASATTTPRAQAFEAAPPLEADQAFEALQATDATAAAEPLASQARHDSQSIGEDALILVEREVLVASVPRAAERIAPDELAALAEVAHTAEQDVYEHDPALNPALSPTFKPPVNPALSPARNAATAATASSVGAPTAAPAGPPRLIEPGRVSLSGKAVLISSTILTAALLLPMLGRALGLPGTLSASLQFSLATVVMLLAGSSVFRTAWRALGDGRSSVDLLAVAGSLSAWLLSIWLWSTGRSADGLYFETAAGVATLALAGQFLVYRTRRRAQDALDDLAAAQPELATRIVSVDDETPESAPSTAHSTALSADHSGSGSGSLHSAPGLQGRESILHGRPIREHELLAEDLGTGEIIMIRPGDAVPADAIILGGESVLDESVLTGDATPVQRGQGEPVFAGTVNGPGRLFARVERVGPDTTLARVLTRIEDAQTSRTAIERKVDRAIGWLVPVALGLAVLTGAFWLWQGAGAESAMARAIAVLVVAFPCALGLAAPAALIAGTRAAARSGILMRDAAVIEALPAIRTVAFEQAGSLTEGRPGVREILPAPGIDRESLLAVTAAIEEQSAHPLAEAIQRFADGAPAIGDAGSGRPPEGERAPAATSVLHVEAEAVRPIEGAGIEGRVRFPGAADNEAVPVFIGSEALMLQQGVDLTPLAEELEIARNDGWTVSLVAMARPDSDPMLLGALLFADTPRPGARNAVQALRKAGIAPVMLSPEPANAARSTGATLGIDETVGELAPQGVDGWIQRAREAGRGVAMVGDAIDDADTLDSADLGVAMSSDSAGRDVAIDTAALTLMRNDVRLVPAAFDIGRRTYGNLRQNLGWALVFNAIGIPLAASGLLSPFAAVVAIAAGMLFVQGNAARLSQWKPDRDITPF